MPDPERVATLVASVEGLAIDIALKSCKMTNGTYDLDDMIQAARLGAVSAAHDYDEDHESAASFSTFAIHRMRQEVSRVYRRSGVAHIPKRDYQSMPKSDRSKHLFNFAYMSTPVNISARDNSELTLGDTISTTDEPSILFKIAVQKTVKHLLARLSPAERDLIEKVYGFCGEPMTIAEAAAIRGLSRQRGWQLVNSALAKIEKLCKRAGVTPSWLSN